jgi:hypothetical protein
VSATVAVSLYANAAAAEQAKVQLRARTQSSSSSSKQGDSNAGTLPTTHHTMPSCPALLLTAQARYHATMHSANSLHYVDSCRYWCCTHIYLTDTIGKDQLEATDWCMTL